MSLAKHGELFFTLASNSFSPLSILASVWKKWFPTLVKFIILVSNLKEISPIVFSWEKEYIKKNYDAILLSKYDPPKKILSYAYLLKNGVGRYNIFF
jgi:hypothetical protein